MSIFQGSKTCPEFWLDKIGRNQARDLVQTEASLAAGWRVLVVWECAVRAMKKQKSTLLIDQVSDWLVNGSEYFQLDEEAALG